MRVPRARAAVMGAGETCACVRAAPEVMRGADGAGGEDAAVEAAAVDLGVGAVVVEALLAVEVGGLLVLVLLLV